jgi:hypothetical protein
LTFFLRNLSAGYFGGKMMQEATNIIDTDQGTVSANIARTFLNKARYFFAPTKSDCNTDILESISVIVKL